MGLTLYRPAYGAKALQGSILNSSKWINFWGAFILVSCRLAILLSADAFCRSVRTSTFTLISISQPSANPKANLESTLRDSALERLCAPTTGLKHLAYLPSLS